jgi:site-specific recombinase XerD
MNQPKFSVSRFENRNGVISWRVEGRLHGVRFRKNLKTKEEAAAEKAALELKAFQATSGIRSAATFLTDAQLREAEDAFRRLDGRTHSLLGYLDFALANYREPAQQKPLADAVADYYATKKAAHERTLLSMRQLRSIGNELNCFKTRFPRALVSDFTAANLIPYLERGKPSLKTYNNRRGLLSTFFKYAFQQDWISRNPIEKTPHHRLNHRRGSAVTITAEQAAKLMAYVEDCEGGEMVPFFALCLFAGIRPCVRFGEITKVQAGSIRLDTGVIHIEPEVSKVRMKRLVTIQPNLGAWLRAYPLGRFPIIPKNAVNMHRKICEEFNLTHDVLRHTFISMFVAKFRSMGEAALQAGNSESIIRKHYLDLKSKEEAERFFGILPQRIAPAAEVVQLAAASAPVRRGEAQAKPAAA